MSSRPHPLMVYKQTHLLRPRGLLAPSPPPHEPTAPAELFTAALLEADSLGLERLTLDAYNSNVIVQLQVQEIRVSDHVPIRLHQELTIIFLGRRRGDLPGPLDLQAALGPTPADVHDTPGSHHRRVRRR